MIASLAFDAQAPLLARIRAARRVPLHTEQPAGEPHNRPPSARRTQPTRASAPGRGATMDAVPKTGAELLAALAALEADLRPETER